MFKSTGPAAMRAATLGLMLIAALFSPSPSFAAETHTSTPFAGVKANTGTVSHTSENGRQVLTLSADFVVPDTPDPHWQVVDSKGNVFLLERLKIKNDGFNRSITLPAYIEDVSKVVIWCAFAEVNLGEASFASPVR